MSFKDCWTYVRSDLYRITGNKSLKLGDLLRNGFFDIGFRFMFWFRLQRLPSPFNIIPRLMCRSISKRHHILIERETEIGYGFRIVHSGPLVINVSTKIGNNVDIYHFSTIGSMGLNAATIGNNVYIGPSVCIVEKVHIGDNATVGAGSVVVKDIPENSTAAGNPAKVISMKTPGRFIWRRWESC